jgi:hypothetical protein
MSLRLPEYMVRPPDTSKTRLIMVNISYVGGCNVRITIFPAMPAEIKGNLFVFRQTRYVFS